MYLHLEKIANDDETACQQHIPKILHMDCQNRSWYLSALAHVVP